jgi:hypothetical protein
MTGKLPCGWYAGAGPQNFSKARGFAILAIETHYDAFVNYFQKLKSGSRPSK